MLSLSPSPRSIIWSQIFRTWLRFRDDAFQKFYKSPSYQSHILTKFGPRAVVEVQEMARVPLRRKLLEGN